MDVHFRLRTVMYSPFQHWTILQIEKHPQYNINSQDNDIALLKLSSIIDFPEDNTVAPVCLPPAGQSYKNVRAAVSRWKAAGKSLW